MFTSNDIGIRTNDHIWVYVSHDIWIARLANTNNNAIFDTNVCFVNASPIQYKSICDDSVQTILIGSSCGLTHAVSDRLTTSKRAFITVMSKILFYLDP